MYIPENAILWKKYPHVLLQGQSLFPLQKNLPDLSSPPALQNYLICIWFKDRILLFFFSYTDPADIQMELWKLNFDLVLLHSGLGYIPCCSKMLCDNFHPWRICFLGSEPELEPPQTILSFISVLSRNLSLPSWDLPSPTRGPFKPPGFFQRDSRNVLFT